jgi:hypothetical protein
VFADHSNSLARDDPFRGYGVAVTPGESGPCAYIAGYGWPNQLLSWDGDRLRDTATSAVADEKRHGVGVVAGDLDADGREELYVHNTESYEGETRDSDLLLDPVSSYPDESDDQWRDLFGLGINAGRDNFTAGRSVAVVDRYGTGRYGVAVAGFAGRLRFYELGEEGELSDMAAAVGLTFEGRARSLLAGPLVTDRMDLFVGTQDGPNRLFRNDGGHFTEVAEAAGVLAPEVNARGVTVSDDALAVCSWEAPNRLFRTDTRTDDGDSTADSPVSPTPTGEFDEWTPSDFAEPSRIRSVVAADFDNDGRDELFCNALGTENRLYRRANRRASDPDTAWTAIDLGPAMEPDGLGTGAAVADFDGDGVLELLLVHGEIEAQPLSLYRAADPGEEWLRVRPTTQHGAPARGASVTLTTDEWTKTRTVCAGSGYLCQMEPVAHFGLGSATPETLHVRWPDGKESVIDRPAERTEHEVPHPMAPRFDWSVTH